MLTNSIKYPVYFELSPIHTMTGRVGWRRWWCSFFLFPETLETDNNVLLL